MEKTSNWRNNPHWYWVLLLPLLVALPFQEDTVMRALLAVALLSNAVLYGRDWARWESRKASSSEPPLTPPPPTPRTP
ncbi:hypothetical protein [Streptomyces sp. NPDC096068]|uniref:hypothetical protein n=1 Tax=Streptomyces sp. NPDC096068 TaxID=3155424 RepID=UPI003323F36A